MFLAALHAIHTISLYQLQKIVDPVDSDIGFSAHGPCLPALSSGLLRVKIESGSWRN